MLSYFKHVKAGMVIDVSDMLIGAGFGDINKIYCTVLAASNIIDDNHLTDEYAIDETNASVYFTKNEHPVPVIAGKTYHAIETIVFAPNSPKNENAYIYCIFHDENELVNMPLEKPRMPEPFVLDNCEAGHSATSIFSTQVDCHLFVQTSDLLDLASSFSISNCFSDGTPWKILQSVSGGDGLDVSWNLPAGSLIKSELVIAEGEQTIEVVIGNTQDCSCQEIIV